MSLAARGIMHLIRRSTAVANANVAIVPRYRCFSSPSFGAGIGTQRGEDNAVDADPRSLVGKKTKPKDGEDKDKAVQLEICGDVEGEEEVEMEEMLQDGPAGKEWGGPTRGGVLREPTRFGDWERKGRCSDF